MVANMADDMYNDSVVIIMQSQSVGFFTNGFKTYGNASYSFFSVLRYNYFHCHFDTLD